jgi:membrane fusion protein, multidrug efflux system
MDEADKKNLMIEERPAPLQIAAPATTPVLLPAPNAPARGKVEPPAEPPKIRRWVWILLAILLVLGIAAYFIWPRIKAKEAADAAQKAPPPPAIPVVTTTARRGDIGVYYSGLGAVTPLATVTIHTRVDGQLMSVRYKEGDTVNKGDLLVEIDDKPYQAALTQAEGQLTRDQASLENAKIDLARYQTLVPLKAIPEQQLATQQALVHQDEGTVKLDEGQIEAAKVNIGYTKITAPVSGRIGLRLVDAGNIVHASDTEGLLVITQMDPISTIFTISEDQLQVVLQKVAAGQMLEVDAYDRDGKTKLAQGSLTTLDNQIDPTTGTLKLRATFDNSKNSLYPNQFVNARLLVQEKHGVTLIPTAAIQRNSNATYVYVVKPDSTVTVRQLTIGTTEGDDSEVTMGLMPGEVVVMTGVDKLQEGSKVQTQSPGTNSQATSQAKTAAAPAATKGGKTKKGK